MTSHKKNLLITGGAGFIGSNFINSVSSKDNEILNIDKITYASNNPSLSQRDIDKITNKNFCLTDLKMTSDAVFEFDPDIIVNFAAESHVDRSIEDPNAFLESNIKSTFNLLESYRQLIKDKGKKEKRFIHISTDEVFGSLSKNDKPFTEESNIDPSSPYAATKGSSDLLVKAWNKTYDLPLIITNCSNNFGPFQNPEKLIPNIIYRINNGLPIEIYGDGSNIRDWIYVEDHVDAILSVVEKGRIGETYNIGGLCEMDNNSIANVLIERVSKFKKLDKNKILNNLKYVEDRPGHDFRYAMNISKIQKEIGWMPKYTFENGIDMTISWYSNFFESEFFDKNKELSRLGLIK